MATSAKATARASLPPDLIELVGNLGVDEARRRLLPLAAPAPDALAVADAIRHGAARLLDEMERGRQFRERFPEDPEDPDGIMPLKNLSDVFTGAICAAYGRLLDVVRAVAVRPGGLSLDTSADWSCPYARGVAVDGVLWLALDPENYAVSEPWEMPDERDDLAHDGPFSLYAIPLAALLGVTETPHLRPAAPPPPRPKRRREKLHFRLPVGAKAVAIEIGDDLGEADNVYPLGDGLRAAFTFIVPREAIAR